MRRYEMMLIFPDTLDEDGAKATFERVKQVLDQQGGRMIEESWWGRRRLAYEIDKRDHGYYAVADLEVSDEGLTELQRQLKLSDNVVRFKTVRPSIRVHKPA